MEIERETKKRWKSEPQIFKEEKESQVQQLPDISTISTSRFIARQPPVEHNTNIINTDKQHLSSNQENKDFQDPRKISSSSVTISSSTSMNSQKMPPNSPKVTGSNPTSKLSGNVIDVELSLDVDDSRDENNVIESIPNLAPRIPSSHDRIDTIVDTGSTFQDPTSENLNRFFPPSRNHPFDIDTSNVRVNIPSGFVATIVKVKPQTTNKVSNVEHSMERGEQVKQKFPAENDENETVQSRPAQIAKPDMRNNSTKVMGRQVDPLRKMRSRWRVKMSKLARKRARKRRKRFKKRALAMLLGESHPHKQKYVLDKHGRKCVDRLRSCHLWLPKCRQSIIVDLACPLSCGKCGHRLNVDVMLRDASNFSHHNSLFHKKTSGQTRAKKQDGKKKNNEINQLPAVAELRQPLDYIQKETSGVSSSPTERPRKGRKRRLRDHRRKRRKMKRRKKGRRRRRMKHGKGRCRDSPNYVKSCRFWVRRGYCADNKLVRGVFCRWSCGVCH